MVGALGGARVEDARSIVQALLVRGLDCFRVSKTWIVVRKRYLFADIKIIPVGTAHVAQGAQVFVHDARPVHQHHEGG